VSRNSQAPRYIASPSSAKAPNASRLESDPYGAIVINRDNIRDTLWSTYKKLIEIVDLSINSMVIFQFAMLVYQRVTNMNMVVLFGTSWGSKMI
jgi:hypothetical protein